MENWTIQEEADRLKARFKGVNRAEFARTYSIKGGDACIYQHISGRRPISLDAALGYAKGFNIGLAEISPRLASELEKVNQKFKHSDAPYYEEIERVIELMENTDDRGRLKCLLAVEDTLAMHGAVTAKAMYTQIPQQTYHAVHDSGATSELERQILENFRRATEEGKRLIISSAVGVTKAENNSPKKNSV